MRKRHRCCYCGFVSARIVPSNDVAPFVNYRSEFMCENGSACQRRIDAREARRQKEKRDAR